jgi:hypothetical protein
MMTEILPRCGVSNDQILPYSSKYSVYMDKTHGVQATIAFRNVAGCL